MRLSVIPENAEANEIADTGPLAGQDTERQVTWPYTAHFTNLGGLQVLASAAVLWAARVHHSQTHMQETNHAVGDGNRKPAVYK